MTKIRVNKDRNSLKKVQENRYFANEAGDYSEKFRAYLGSSKGTLEFEEAIINSWERYERKMRDYLMAIVLPGGHCKTYLSKRYDLIDVDEMISVDEHNQLMLMREQLVKKRDTKWDAHNKLWWKLVNEQLDYMEINKPTVILVHSEEFALEIGATVIGAAILEQDQFENNIKMRSNAAKHFSRMSREIVSKRSLTKYKTFVTNEEIERWVINLCNLHEVAIPCPYKYTRKFPNKYYSDDLPEWVYTGQATKFNIYQLIAWYKEGRIPKVCVDYFVKYGVTPAAEGFGVMNCDWVPVLTAVRAYRGTRKTFSTDDDMMELFPPESAMEKHRANLTIRRLDKVCNILRHDDVKEILRHHLGERHSFVTSVVSHWKSLGQFTSISRDIFSWYLVKEEKWQIVFKKIHNLIRISNFFMDRELTELDRQSLMYMELLVGKRLYTLDFREVLDERRGVQLHKLGYDDNLGCWTEEQYWRDFHMALESAHTKVRLKQQRRYNVNSFVSFWKKRREWVTKGSTVLNNLDTEKKKYVIQYFDDVMHTLERRHNKTSLLECEDVLTLLQANIDSFNATKITPKYESGKERALLPGTLLHYIVFSYVLYFAEQQEQIGSVRLNSGDDDNIEYFESKMFIDLAHLLYDWANFNAQHESTEMKMVIDKLSEVVDAPEDYKYFVSCISESMYHMWLIDDNGDKHKIDRGLYSGWRGTTWINSVLNYVYLNIGIMNFNRLYKSDSVVYVDHGGDDVDIAMDNTLDCMRLYTVMDRIGNVANPMKQMIDKKSEFFRVTISKNGAYASPTRALANFVSGNWEGAGAQTVRDKVMALMDQIAKLRRRGVDKDFCDAATFASIAHWCRVKTEDKWEDISDHVMHAPLEQNGLGIPDEEGYLWILDKPIPTGLGQEFWTKLPGVNSSQDFVDELEQELMTMGINITRKQELIHKIAESSYDFSLVQDMNDWQTLCRYQGIVVGKKLAVEPKEDRELFEDFLNFMGSGMKAIDLNKVLIYAEMSANLECNGKGLTKSEVCKIVTGMNFDEKVFEFKPNVYYRRLVPEYIGILAENFCMYMIQNVDISLELANELFERVCYTANRALNLHL